MSKLLSYKHLLRRAVEAICVHLLITNESLDSILMCLNNIIETCLR